MLDDCLQCIFITCLYHSLECCCITWYVKEFTIMKKVTNKKQIFQYCFKFWQNPWNACLCARVLCVFTCLRAYVLCVLPCLRAYVLGVLTCLAWLACLRAYVLLCSACLRTYVLGVLACVRACVRSCYDEMFYFLTCLRIWCLVCFFVLFALHFNT